MQALLKKAFTSTSASEYALGDLKRNDINAVFPYSMTKVNPGSEEVNDAEVLGERIVLEPESMTCREVLTLQIHPAVRVIDRQMMRMCPVFAQAREVVRSQYNPNKNVVLDEGNDSDSESSAAPDVLDEAVMNFNFDWPYNYGSIADIKDYRPAQLCKIDGDVLVISPQYRIYIELLGIEPEVGDTDDTFQQLRLQEEELDVRRDDDIPGRWSFRVSQENDDLLYCNKRIAFRVNGNIVIAEYVDTEHDGDVSTYRVKFEDIDTNISDLSESTDIYAIRDDSIEDEQLLRAINALSVDVPQCALGANLMGFVSRHENVLISDFKGIVTLACLMAGKVTVLVQSKFNFDLWLPGELMYIVLNQDEDDDTCGYEISYKHLADIEEGEVYALVGVYIKPSGHPYYKCCDISSVPCVSEEFRIK